MRPTSRRAGVTLAVLAAWACAAPAPSLADGARPAAPAAQPDRVRGLKAPPVDTPLYRRGVVAVANPYGAEAGARVLQQGGNAIDAAVAIAYALNVVEPQSAGMGGGGFMLVHLAKTGETFSIDTRETAPAGATRDMFSGVSNASRKGVAVGVPGMVRGTAQVVAEHGKLPLKRVLAPAIELAEDGFAATQRYADVSCNDRALNSPEARDFFCPGGVAPAPGTLVRNLPLANTLKLIARHGADCFYQYQPDKGCDIAQGILAGQARSTILVNGVEQAGKPGSMTLADLAAYQPARRAPIEGSYRGYTIKAMAPPSSGALTVLQILGMLERFPLGDASQGFGFGSVKTLQTMADAMRLAFADRAIWMADADFVPVPTVGLIHPDYLALRSGLITPGQRIDPNPVADDPRPYEIPGFKRGQRLAVALPVTGPDNGTTHFSVADRWGNVVSYTNTIESSHGIGTFAGYTLPDGSFRNFGFLLNNELTDFNTSPSTNPFTGTDGYNDVQPQKRPRSSMTPTMIFDPEGRPILAYGSPGGATIINSVVNVTINLVDHGMGLQAAIDAGRISVASANPSITLESRFPTETADGLRALGYSVSIGDVGSVQAVGRLPQSGLVYGAADDRREGTVIGLPRPRP
ncbi:MAG: gamma-glutamyltransferase [Burkholderiaceae bacterium]|nr:gamma-glutamyltransferase [Rhodoferax sp.]MCP5283613.1 gamma-glutamyltransferase [Burkholderiaceae bacterium]